tara:strand:- start:166 stop:384 length:219 start_codon:yes stop_codon:yes gene_type:complete
MGFFKDWIGKLFGKQQDSFANKTIDTLKKVKGKAQKMKVRARDAKGRFIKDDPSTPENEAWTEKEREYPGRE